MGREECRRPQIVAPRERFAALLEMAEAAVRYGASLRVYEDCFVVEDGEGAIAVAAV